MYFCKLNIPAGKEINNIVNLEKRIISELKLLKDKDVLQNVGGEQHFVAHPCLLIAF